MTTVELLARVQKTELEAMLLREALVRLVESLPAPSFVGGMSAREYILSALNDDQPDKV